jgi:hypothetical protein
MEDEKNRYLKKVIPPPPWEGPPLPSGLSVTWNELFETLKTYMGAVEQTIFPTTDPKLLPDAFYLTYKSISMAAVSAVMNNPKYIESWASIIQTRTTVEGLFDKMDVVYVNLNPPPVFWDYKCKKCRWWGPTVGQQDKTCKVVAGTISPQGWCAIWVPPKDYKALSWPKELIQGRW